MTRAQRRNPAYQQGYDAGIAAGASRLNQHTDRLLKIVTIALHNQYGLGVRRLQALDQEVNRLCSEYGAIMDSAKDGAADADFKLEQEYKRIMKED